MPFKFTRDLKKVVIELGKSGLGNQRSEEAQGKDRKGGASCRVADEAPPALTGKFFCDRQEIPW
jgi:hypothetical protein